MPTKRVTVQIWYDDTNESWERSGDHYGTLVVNEERGATIHDQMRGVDCAVRVDVPRSYIDQYYRTAIMYASPERVREIFDTDNAETREQMRLALVSEAKEYRNRADGYVFGYTATLRTFCVLCVASEEIPSECPHCKLETIDACGGHVSEEPQKELIEWMGENLDEDAKAALAIALGDGWTGNYPNAGIGWKDI